MTSAEHTRRIAWATSWPWVVIGASLMAAIMFGAAVVRSSPLAPSSTLTAAGMAAGRRWTAAESVDGSVVVRPPAGVAAPASLTVERPVAGAALQAIERDPGGNFVAVWSTPGSTVLLMVRHPFIRGERHSGLGFELPLPVEDRWLPGTPVLVRARPDGAAIRLTRADPTTGRTATVIRQASFDPFCRPVAPGLSAESH